MFDLIAQSLAAGLMGACTILIVLLIMRKVRRHHLIQRAQAVGLTVTPCSTGGYHVNHNDGGPIYRETETDLRGIIADMEGYQRL
jgi:hypothetical protein